MCNGFSLKIIHNKKNEYTTENCRVAGSRQMGRHGKPCCSVNPDSLFQYSKTCLKRHLKLDKTKVLMEKKLLNEDRKDCRILPLEHSVILLTCINR